MPKMPFFSILIPTKNRNHVVSFAIQSVLEQTFGDFEIIVSDNDDSDTLTRDAVSKFSDSRIKYYRTSGKLSMPDNWEFALSKSSGSYVTILEDKQALYPNALEIIHKCASAKDTKIITWHNDVLDDENSILRKYHGSNTILEISSDEILRDFVGRNLSCGSFPRMINSCVCREFVDFVIQKTPLNRFFIPVSPDICAGIIQLNYVDFITQIDSSLTIFGAPSLSNAIMMIKRDKNHKRFFEDISKDETFFYSHVPIKSYYIVANCIANDYIRLRELLKGRLDSYIISPSTYITACFKSIIEIFAYGGTAKNEFSLWKEYYYAQDLSIRKGLWLSSIKTIVKVYLYLFLNKRPWFGNIVYKISGHKTKLFKVYGNILNQIRDWCFLPDVINK